MQRLPLEHVSGALIGPPLDIRQWCTDDDGVAVDRHALAERIIGRAVVDIELVLAPDPAGAVARDYKGKAAVFVVARADDERVTLDRYAPPVFLCGWIARDELCLIAPRRRSGAGEQVDRTMTYVPAVVLTRCADDHCVAVDRDTRTEPTVEGPYKLSDHSPVARSGGPAEHENGTDRP
jgi:hypothetical protein